MKKTPLHRLPDDVPWDIGRFLSDADIFDSSFSPQAKVYFIDKQGGYYLKCSHKGALQTEAAMTGYFHAKGLGAEVLQYISGERDWLLTSAVHGEDCLYADYLSDPRRLCDTIAGALRKLHETDFGGCPVPDRTSTYLALAESNYRRGQYDTSHFHDGFCCRSADEAYRILQEGKNALQSKVLLHGDYCLPNIILDRWKLSGLIDLGNGGVGDRHIDLFWGLWTLWRNLKTDRYGGRFLDAYGRDAADPALLNVIAAAEAFG